MRTLLYNRAAPICNGSTLVISFLLRQKLFYGSALFHGFRNSSKLREDFVATVVLQYSKEIETKNLPMTYTNIRNNSILHNNPIIPTKSFHNIHPQFLYSLCIFI